MPRPSPTESRWRAVLVDFHRSGLTHADFCQQRGLSLHSFRKRLYRPKPGPPPIERGGSATTHPPARFLPVTIRPEELGPDRPLTLLLADHRRIAVGPGFDPDTLRRLIDCLERRS